MLFAQKEAFDIVTYTPPAGWQKDVKENVTTYTIVDKKTSQWCQVGIIKSTVSKGSIDADFNSEWQELIVKSYNVTDAPQVNEVQEADGWKIKAGGGKFIFNNANAMAMLTTMSGYDRCVSIVSTTNSQDYIKDIEALLASVDLVKPQTTEQPQGDITDTKTLIGVWGANASDNSSYRMKNGIMNYIKRQYYFNTDGTYNFVSKTFDPLMDKILLAKESGTFQMSGNNVIITPKKSVLEAWSKKDGADKWGKLLSTQNIPLEKTSYQFTKHYFSGIQIWALVLQADKATNRDGPFSNNTSFSNAWYYNPISANNLIIELPDGQKLATEEIKKNPEKQITDNASNGFHYTTTNFVDGWTATEQADWVEVTKGNIKVLLHYPKEGTIIASDPEPHISNAWNILVAPRYNNLKNYKTAYISTYDRPYIGMGYATENATGKEVFVVLFRQGQTGWIECICPDKNSFIQYYKFDPETIQWDSELSLLTPLANMATYNRFAVDAADLRGKWTSDFTGIQQLYSVYTGQYAGMNIHQSNEEFNFSSGNAYNWKLLVVNGMAGNAKFNQVKSAGNFTVPNSWQIHFSMIENKARTYHAFFSCIKGARILNLLDAGYPGSGIYTKYGIAK